MTEQEFIQGVADGTLMEIDVIYYVVAARHQGASVEHLLEEMFAQALSYNTHKIVFVEGSDEIKDYGGVSYEDQLKSNRLCDAMEVIEQRFLPKPQHVLELETDEAKAILQKAVDVGLCSCNEGIWEWGETSALFGYFVLKVGEKLDIRWSNNKIKWQPFTLFFFNMDKAERKAAKEWANSYKMGNVTEPENYELVLECVDDLPEPQQREQEEPQQGIYLPPELQQYKEQVDTPKARKYFARAVKNGVIERTNTGYRKCQARSKAQLAYFLQCVYVDAVKGGVFPDTALCKLFCESGLKQAANKVASNKTGKPKQGAKLIDDIFEE